MTNIKVITPLDLEDSEFYRLYLKNKNDKGIWISVDISEFTIIDTTEWQQEYQFGALQKITPHHTHMKDNK